MLWTCPKCQNQNEECSLYCKYCGERKVGEKPIKTSQPRSHISTPTPKTTPKIQHLSNPEQSFYHQLKPVDFEVLDTYAAISMAVGFICYASAIIIFFFSLFNDLGFWSGLVMSLTPLIIGFSLQIVSEVINLFLHGQKSWYLTSKYTYVNSELTSELLKKIEMLEAQIIKLCNDENESKN